MMKMNSEQEQGSEVDRKKNKRWNEMGKKKKR